MRVSARFHRAALGDIMMVKGQKALQKKHHQKSAQQPRHAETGGIELMACVWQQAQQRQAQHQPGNKADGDLQPRVGQLEQAGQHPAQQGREEGQQTVARQRQCRGS